MLMIDGEVFPVDAVVELGREAEFLYKYAERTESGALESELIGVYINHSIKISGINDPALYDRLYDKLTEPVERHAITVPGNNGTYTYDAYMGKVSDQLKLKHNGVYHWGDLMVNFKATKPART